MNQTTDFPRKYRTPAKDKIITRKRLKLCNCAELTVVNKPFSLL